MQTRISNYDQGQSTQRGPDGDYPATPAEERATPHQHVANGYSLALLGYGSMNSPVSATAQSSPNTTQVPEARMSPMLPLGSTQARKSRKSNANPGEPSQLAKKRATLKATYGNDMVTRDMKLKGSIYFESGRMQWWDPDDCVWKDAAFHSDYRPELIQMDIESNQGYLMTPDHGEAAYDVTSSCDFLSQNEWQFDDREDLARILDEDGNAVMILEERPKRTFPPGEVPPMVYRGQVLLDGDNHPVYDFRGIPKTFSSKLEGGRMEALRRVFPFLHASDFRARMPRKILSHGKVKDIYGLSTLRHRASRFRDDHQLVAFDKREGSAAKNERWTQSGTGLSHPSTRDSAFPRPSASSSHDRATFFDPSISVEESYPQDPDLFEESTLENNVLDSSSHINPGLQNIYPPRTYGSQLGKQAYSQYSLQGSRLTASFPITSSSSSPQYFNPDQSVLEEMHSNSNVDSRSAIAPALEHATPQDFRDYRFIAPQTPFEQLQVELALTYTKIAYVDINGRNPPITPRAASYQRQVMMIALHHLENYHGIGPCPELPQLGVWRNGFGSMPAPSRIAETGFEIAEETQEHPMQIDVNEGYPLLTIDNVQEEYSKNPKVGASWPMDTSGPNKRSIAYAPGLNWDDSTQKMEAPFNSSDLGDDVLGTFNGTMVQDATMYQWQGDRA